MAFVLNHYVSSLDKHHVCSTHDELKRAKAFKAVYENTLPKGDYMYITKED